MGALLAPLGTLALVLLSSGRLALEMLPADTFEGAVEVRACGAEAIARVGLRGAFVDVHARRLCLVGADRAAKFFVAVFAQAVVRPDRVVNVCVGTALVPGELVFDRVCLAVGLDNVHAVPKFRRIFRTVVAWLARALKRVVGHVFAGRPCPARAWARDVRGRIVRAAAAPGQAAAGVSAFCVDDRPRVFALGVLAGAGVARAVVDPLADVAVAVRVRVRAAFLGRGSTGNKLLWRGWCEDVVLRQIVEPGFAGAQVPPFGFEKRQVAVTPWLLPRPQAARARGVCAAWVGLLGAFVGALAVKLVSGRFCGPNTARHVGRPVHGAPRRAVGEDAPGWAVVPTAVALRFPADVTVAPAASFEDRHVRRAPTKRDCRRERGHRCGAVTRGADMVCLREGEGVAKSARHVLALAAVVGTPALARGWRTGGDSLSSWRVCGVRWFEAVLARAGGVGQHGG